MYKKCELIFHYVNLISILSSISFDGGKNHLNQIRVFSAKQGFLHFLVLWVYNVQT